MGLMASWGFGGELVVRVADAIANMRRASFETRALRKDFNELKGEAKGVAVEVSGARTALEPLGVAFDNVEAKAKSLTAELERNQREVAQLEEKVDKSASALERARTKGHGFSEALDRMKGGVGQIVGGLGQLGMVLAPVSLLFGATVARSSQLAADLEANKLTMRVLVGDAAKSEELIGRIRENAAATPFEVGELIDTSKRLLNLTGSNIDRNMELLQLTETMAAMNPTKTVADAAEALLDATSGGGFERLKEFPGLTLRAEMFKDAGESGGKAWGDAIVAELQKRVAEKTHGENLVGALAETMKGRASTLLDAVNTLMTDVGTAINEGGKGWIISLTDTINANAPMVTEAVKEVFGEATGWFDQTFGPLLEQLKAWWSDLGEEGQKRVVKMVVWFGMLASAAVSVGGVLGVAGLALSGLVSIGSGLVTILGALTPEIAMVGALIGAAAGAIGGLMDSGVLNWMDLLGMAIGAAFGPLGPWLGLALVNAEGFLPWLTQMGGILWDIATTIGGGLWNAWSAFYDGFLPQVRVVGDVIMSNIGQPFLNLWATVRDLFGFLMPSTEEAIAGWRQLGAVFGWVVGWVLRVGSAVIGTVVNLVEGALSIFRPFLQAIGLLGRAVGGLISGTMSGSDVFKVLLTGFVAWIGGIGTAIVSIMAVVLETVLNLIGTALSAIPGVGDNLSAWVFSGSQSIGDFRRSMQDDFAAAIERNATATKERDAAKADAASSVELNLGESPIEVTAEVEAVCEVDGREIARSQGRQAAKASDRGTGPKLPTEQRARVLRRGLEVTPLRAAEV